MFILFKNLNRYDTKCEEVILCILLPVLALYIFFRFFLAWFMNLCFRTSFSVKNDYRYLPIALTKNEYVGVINKIKTTIM